MSDLYWSVA